MCVVRDCCRIPAIRVISEQLRKHFSSEERPEREGECAHPDMEEAWLVAGSLALV